MIKYMTMVCCLFGCLAPQVGGEEAATKASEAPPMAATKTDAGVPASKSEKPNGKQAEEAPVTAESEAAILAFAREHHPELADLIEKLKSNRPQGYRQAIRELGKAQDRLTKLRSKNPERAEFELELWKVDSRIHLLTARSVMSDTVFNDTDLKDQLRLLVTKRQQQHLKLLEYDRSKVAERLSKLEAQISEESSPHDVEKECDRLLKSAKNRIAPKTGKPRPQSK